MVYLGRFEFNSAVFLPIARLKLIIIIAAANVALNILITNNSLKGSNYAFFVTGLCLLGEMVDA